MSPGISAISPPRLEVEWSYESPIAPLRACCHGLARSGCADEAVRFFRRSKDAASFDLPDQSINGLGGRFFPRHASDEDR